MLKNDCCSICLSINKRTINIYGTDLQYVYENLANFKISDECWMCYICHTRLRQCHQLQQLVIQTRGLIDDIFQNKVQDDAGDLSGMSQTTICNICRQVALAIVAHKPDWIKMPQSDAEQNAVIADFYAISGFRQVIGTIDCTHIQIPKVAGDIGQYYCCG